MKYIVQKTPYPCNEFEKNFINTVIHEYYFKNKIDVVSRNKGSFKCCNTKYDYGCQNTKCKFYKDREPNFSDNIF